jgi:hypothetical protein
LFSIGAFCVDSQSRGDNRRPGKSPRSFARFAQRAKPPSFASARLAPLAKEPPNQPLQAEKNRLPDELIKPDRPSQPINGDEVRTQIAHDEMPTWRFAWPAVSYASIMDRPMAKRGRRPTARRIR